MIELPVKAGSPEWVAARISIPTASRFSEIITPRTMKPSASATRYVAQLCAEWLLGASLDEGATQWMERGTDLEAQAIKYYEMQRDVDTTDAGFCLIDDRSCGCTPDRFVSTDGGLEIKCPSPAVHVMHLLGNPADEYRAQVQGCLWITGRKWWDLLSFHPELPPALVRVERDMEFIGALAEAMDVFLATLAWSKDHLLALGCTPRQPVVPTPDDGSALFTPATPEQLRAAGRFRDPMEVHLG